MTQYNFVTTWKYHASVENIWRIITDPEKWPSWWKGVRKVEMLHKGDANGIGIMHRFTWRSQLPYNLVFESRVVRVILHQEVAGVVTGELAGTGVWYFSQQGSLTTMQYRWDVSTTKPWMNAMTPIARPFFAWNHDVVMRWGSEGLAALLGTPLVE